MPIFISYSHENEDFVERLGAQLVLYGVRVWIDSWELNAGDSLINRIQSAIQTSDALIVILSNASVESEWCKKELSSGLIRELEEKRVVVLPVLIEDCNIPLFLKDKKYADFRKSYDVGLSTILGAVAKVASESMGRLTDRPEFYVDWSMDWGTLDGFSTLRLTLVESAKGFSYTILTEITVIADSIGTLRFLECEAKRMESEENLEIINMLAKYIDNGNKIQLVIDNEFPQKSSIALNNPETEANYKVNISSRRLGEDNGKNVLVDIGGQIQIIKQTLDRIRRKN